MGFIPWPFQYYKGESNQTCTKVSFKPDGTAYALHPDILADRVNPSCGVLCIFTWFSVYNPSTICIDEFAFGHGSWL